jgi:ParB family chromosome partitioning protein
VETVSIAAIDPNLFQAGQSIDRRRIQELADEIKEIGLWPGSLRAPQVDGHYELVFGDRRLEALKLLGRKSVDLEVVNLDDTAMATQALVENLQHEGLTDIQKANAIKHLLGLRHHTLKQLAHLLGYNEQRIKEYVRMADPPDLHDVLMDWLTFIKQWRRECGR